MKTSLQIQSTVLSAAASIFVAAGCSTNPSTGRLQLDLLPADQVAQMGHEAKPQLTQEYGGEVKSPELREYVGRVGQDLARHVEPVYADVEWDFTVLDSDVVNAFALPGGHVFISRGLLQMMDNEAQVAGVLGHEIGHVTAKHVNERLSQTLLAQLGVAAVGAATETQLITEGANLLAQGTLLKFSRNQESEADSQGLKYMTAAGYDPSAMLEVMHILDEASKGPSPPEILSSHPLPATRITRIQKELDADYGYTQNDPRYQKHKKRFEQGARPYLGSRSARLSRHGPSGVHGICPICNALSRAASTTASGPAVN